jgi:hypothetical protein
MEQQDSLQPKINVFQNQIYSTSIPLIFQDLTLFLTSVEANIDDFKDKNLETLTQYESSIDKEYSEYLFPKKETRRERAIKKSLINLHGEEKASQLLASYYQEINNKDTLPSLLEKIDEQLSANDSHNLLYHVILGNNTNIIADVTRRVARDYSFELILENGFVDKTYFDFVTKNYYISDSKLIYLTYKLFLSDSYANKQLKQGLLKLLEKYDNSGCFQKQLEAFFQKIHTDFTDIKLSDRVLLESDGLKPFSQFLNQNYTDNEINEIIRPIKLMREEFLTLAKFRYLFNYLQMPFYTLVLFLLNENSDIDIENHEDVKIEFARYQNLLTVINTSYKPNLAISNDTFKEEMKDLKSSQLSTKYPLLDLDLFQNKNNLSIDIRNKRSILELLCYRLLIKNPNHFLEMLPKSK